MRFKAATPLFLFICEILFEACRNEGNHYETTKMIKHSFRSTNDSKDFASPCNINNFDSIENGGG